jgi:dolichol-phosphate mannosyltransferase
MSNTELCLVMPVYNEEGVIAHVIQKWTQEFTRLGISFNIHAYNDGSRDKSLYILHSLASKNINLIVHDKNNSGHGPTILQGYRDNSNVEWIFQTDSDDEIGPESFEKLWSSRNQYDFLIGKRIRAHQPLQRKIVSSISRIAVRLFYGNTIYDVNSPYRLMRCAALKDAFMSIPDGTFAPNVIISGIVALKRLRAYEIPVAQSARTTGVISIRKWKLLKAAAKSLIQTITYRFPG